MISIALIDEYRFTRESISGSLQQVCNILNVAAFSSSDQCLASDISFDVILFHAHENSAKHKNGDGSLSRIKQLLPLAPVIILCDVDSFDLVSAAFDSGVRGYIPTESTSLEIAIEIMYLVKAGGTFVPPSSLSPQRIKLQGDPTPVTTHQFTPRQLEVLECLKRGQTNKSIAFGLKMSESSVKTHIQNIMRKMGASNRTEVACLVQRLELGGMQPVG
jgi:DNA-binding NarL/FixJ family response regulator